MDTVLDITFKIERSGNVLIECIEMTPAPEAITFTTAAHILNSQNISTFIHSLRKVARIAPKIFKEDGFTIAFKLPGF